jgi:hypothetical protein
MAVLTSTNLTLADWSKRVDPDGKIATVAELLSQTNEILTDAVFKEGNLPTGDRVVIRTGLPTVYWRALNKGIPSSKSTTAQVDEACGILEARSEIDVDLAMLNGNTDAFRLSEDVAFLEAMNQTMATTMFYGNPATDPLQPLGLSSRYSLTTAGNGQNILLGQSATADANTSVWLVCWGDNTVYCPFPKGSKAGLLHENLGVETVYTPSAAGATTASATERMRALVTRYQWKTGLVVKDWRYCVRIPNLRATDLSTLANTQAVTPATPVTTNIIHQMARAVYRIPNLAMGRPVFYMNRTVHSALTRLAMEKSSSVLAINQGLNQFGGPMSWLSFMGVPIRCCDALVNTEALVA